MNRDDKFLKTEYRKMLIPIMCSVLGGTINALVDSVIVSQRLGSDGLSAVNLCMPVYFALCIFGSLIAYGAAFLSARSAGQEQMEESEKYYHTALLLSAILGVLFMLAGLFLSGYLSLFLSQGSSLNAYVSEYCFVTLLGALPFLFSYLAINYLQLEGKRKAISNMVIIMVVSDVVLDILFLFVLNLGMTGAALASVLSTLFATVYGFFVLQQGESNYKFQPRKLRFFATAEMIRYGSPAALGNFYDAAKLTIINLLVLHFGSMEDVAVWAALNTLSELSLVIIQGVPRVGGPMIGVYYAARENSAIRILGRIELRTGLIFSAIFAGLLVALSYPIRLIFALSSPLPLPLACLGVSVILFLVCAIWDSYFNAVGKIWLSNLLVMYRKLLFPIVSILILVYTGGYLWLFLPIGAALPLLAGFVVVFAVSRRAERTGKPLSRILLLDDSLEREHKILDFSIPAVMAQVCEASDQIKDFCMLNQIPSRQTMKLGLSIEELLNVIVQKNTEIRNVDLRAFVQEDDAGIRIRYTGQKYNPFDDKESDDDFLLGINMLKKMCSLVTHTYTLGMNTINIMFSIEKGGNKRAASE